MSSSRSKSTAWIRHCYTPRSLCSSRLEKVILLNGDDANLRQSRGGKECQNWEHEHLLQINDDANFDKKGGTTNSGRAAAQASLAYNNDGSTR